jgi:8-oxo-dGTP pyrophosphatase MutT (NUDIX family)
MQKKQLESHIIAYLAHHENDSHALETLDFLATQEAFWQRENQAGHLTASSFIVNEARNKALLTHHLKLDKWFQLGGHIEPQDATIFEAAMREAKEESGLLSLRLAKQTLFDIDVHLIPCSKSGFPAHNHYDVRVLLIANENEAINFDKNESKQVKWFYFDDIRAVSTEIAMHRMVEKAIM